MSVARQQETHPRGRMTLDAVVTGRQKRPRRTLLYGVEGIGKSTFGADSPQPIFLGAEEGTSHLDVTRFPQPENFADIREAVTTLEMEEHEYQTLVLDTLDWAEPLIWQFICERDNKDNIEAYGYGKGYTAALDTWRSLLNDFDRLRIKRGMQITLLAHSWVKAFKNPEGDDFDRYELKINNKAAGVIKEWCDDVLFSNYETFATEDARTKRVKGISTGARLIYTTRTAAYDAKNRANLPESMPLSWDEYWGAVQKHYDPAYLRDYCTDLIAKLPEELSERAAGLLEKAGTEIDKLHKLNNWINSQITLAGGSD